MLENKKGFNLLGIIIVMAIVLVLTGIVLFGEDPDKRVGKTRDAQRATDVAAISNAINLYTLDNDELPPDIADAPMEAGTKYVLCDQAGLLTCDGQTWDCMVVDDQEFLEMLGGELPVDPMKEDASDTGYYITRDENNDGIIVGACEVYDAEEIMSRSQAAFYNRAPIISNLNRAPADDQINVPQSGAIWSWDRWLDLDDDMVEYYAVIYSGHNCTGGIVESFGWATTNGIDPSLLNYSSDYSWQVKGRSQGITPTDETAYNTCYNLSTAAEF